MYLEPLIWAFELIECSLSTDRRGTLCHVKQHNEMTYYSNLNDFEMSLTIDLSRKSKLKFKNHNQNFCFILYHFESPGCLYLHAKFIYSSFVQHVMILVKF